MSQLAIITGASSGIGAACAKLFRAAGREVVNVSRRTCPVDGVTNVLADLADTAALASLTSRLQHIIDDYSPTDICIVHNAALMLSDTAQQCDDDALLRVLQVNVTAINAINRQLLPSLPRDSSILIVGSTLSEKAVPGAFSYIVSKHAQIGLMRATCQDLMGTGIHTALICPGFTDTEMLRNHIGNDALVIESISQMNSFGRLVQPEEIARLIVWAHDNPAINGAALHANLGQVER